MRKRSGPAYKAAVMTKVCLGATLLMLSGCQWGWSTYVGEGDLGGRGFDTSGTVFTYVDKNDDNLVEDIRPRAVVFMTWLIFNPAGDLNDLDGAELEDYRHEMRLRDAAAIIFDDAAQLAPGDRLESLVTAGEEQSTDGMTVRLHFAPERLSAWNTYDSFQPYGSVRKVTVNLGTVGLAPPTAAIGGELEIEISLGENDPADALTGVLKGTFNGPMVDERVAEHNLGLLDAETLLGLPLQPRPPEATP